MALDCAVLIQMLRPGSYVTIRDYVTDVFVPYILSWCERNNRVVILWNVYSKTNLKSGTQEQRGSGARRRVTFSTKIPSNSAAFLCVDLNKQEFFVELAKTLKNKTLPQGKQLFITILMLMLVQSPPAHRRNLSIDFIYMRLLPPSLVIVE